MRVLLIVVAALSTACAATGAQPRPFPRPAGHPAAGPPGSSPTVEPARGNATSGSTNGYELSGTALALRGTPYRNGGTDPNGFDCSGFVWYVFAQHGVSVPRTVEDQFRVGGVVPPPDLRAGDLVFFSTTAPGASHVGILVGGDSFVHAPSERGVVRIDRLGAPYWSSRFLGARRVR